MQRCNDYRCKTRERYINVNINMSYTDVELLFYQILYHGAPTISGVKPASLIRFSNKEHMKLMDLWNCHKNNLQEMSGLSYIEVFEFKQSVCVLFYNREWLEDIVRDDEVRDFLSTKGYDENANLDETLKTLQSNYHSGCPDEIGVFLGYPLSDVMAFSSDKKDNSILNGYWRVYSKVQEAIKTFNAYDEARYNVSKQLVSGIKPSRLLQAV